MTLTAEINVDIVCDECEETLRYDYHFSIGTGCHEIRVKPCKNCKANNVDVEKIERN